MSDMSSKPNELHIVPNSMFNEFNVVNMQAMAIKDQDSMLCNFLSRT